MWLCWGITKFTSGRILTVLVLGSLSLLTSAQQQTVSILLFYEEPNSIKNFDSAVEFIKQDRSLGIDIGEVHKVNANGTEAMRLIQNLCKDIDEAFKKTQKPDIVIDFTRKGLSSEAVKMIVKVMNLPTISGTFGQEGDIRSWRDLKTNMKKYLIQVAPPADMVPQSVRSIVSHRDMTTAALLFDNDYEMNHKNKSLLKYMPTRHIITSLETSEKRIRKQIDNLASDGYVNFFIAASLSNISNVLAEASNLKMKNGSYFTEKYRLYSMSLERGLPKCSECRTNVTVVHLKPKLSEAQSKRRAYFESKGNMTTQSLMDMFYFDLTTNAVLSVGQMKKDGKWVAPPRRVCSETTEESDDFTLPLFETFKSDAISKDNLLGPFYLDPDNAVGRSHSNFEMEIRRLVFKPMQAEPETNVLLGTWIAGFTEKDLIDTKVQ